MRILLMAALMTVFSFQAQAHHEDLIDTFATLKPSVGALYALQSDGDMDFLCTATAVDREGDATVILTAYHCVRRGVSYLINFGDNYFRPLRVWQVPHYELGPDEQRAYNEPKTDMALFLMDGSDVPIVPMAETSKMQDGEGLAMVGYPKGLAKISYQGTVAGRYDRTGSDQFDYILMQIFGAPGSSGSAVVSAGTGEIIGVLVSATQGRGLPVIFATPIDYRKWLKAVPTGEDTGGEEVADIGTDHDK